MAYIQIEIDDETKIKFQKKLLDEGKTMTDRILELINEDLKKKKNGK